VGPQYPDPEGDRSEESAYTAFECLMTLRYYVNGGFRDRGAILWVRPVDDGGRTTFKYGLDQVRPVGADDAGLWMIFRDGFIFCRSEGLTKRAAVQHISQKRPQVVAAQEASDVWTRNDFRRAYTEGCLRGFSSGDPVQADLLHAAATWTGLNLLVPADTRLRLAEFSVSRIGHSLNAVYRSSTAQLWVTDAPADAVGDIGESNRLEVISARGARVTLYEECSDAGDCTRHTNHFTVVWKDAKRQFVATSHGMPLSQFKRLVLTLREVAP
jgi:hypothetical protein